MKINGSNEWGWLLYGFHPDGVNIAKMSEVSEVSEPPQPTVSARIQRWAEVKSQDTTRNGPA
jgi:hypothetical protein